MTTVNASSTPTQTLLDAMNSKKTATAAVDEAQNRFMTLLVTQMRNQDPLNPMDNAQVTSQMAQLSTVTGIDKLNNTLETLINNVQMGQSYQASNLIGRSVLTPGDTIQLNEEVGFFGIELPIGADKVKVNIKDGSGATIRTIELGKQDAGTLPLTWDGYKDDGTVASAGNYKFEVQATSGSSSAESTTLSFAKVLSISNYSTGVKLNLSNLMTVDTTAIKEIF